MLPKASTLLCAPAPSPICPPSAGKATGCSLVKAEVSPGSPSTMRTWPTRVSSPTAWSLDASVWPRAGGGDGLHWLEAVSAPGAEPPALGFTSEQNSSESFWTSLPPCLLQGYHGRAGWRGTLCHLPHCSLFSPLLSLSQPPHPAFPLQTEAAIGVNHCGWCGRSVREARSRCPLFTSRSPHQ